jgi:hypothetical protein
VIWTAAIKPTQAVTTPFGKGLAIKASATSRTHSTVSRTFREFNPAFFSHAPVTRDELPEWINRNANKCEVFGLREKLRPALGKAFRT